MNPARVASLDGLRAGCALMVMAGHLVTESGLPHYAILDGLLSFGVEAVMGFFVLSGFLLTGQPADSPRRFITLRLVRILPLYYVAAIFCLVAMLMTGGGVTLPSVVANFLLVQSLNWEPLFPMVSFGQSWSLSYEVWFYVGYAAILAVPWLRLPLVVASLAAGLSLYLWPQGPGPVTALAHFLAFFSIWMLGNLVVALRRRGHAVSVATGVFMLVVGVCLGHVPLSSPAKFDYARLLGFAIGFTVLLWSLLPEPPGRRGTTFDLGLVPRVIVATVTLLLLWLHSESFRATKWEFTVLLVLATVAPAAIARPAARILRPAMPMLGYVAGLSYALYLIHYPLLHLFNRIGGLSPLPKVLIVAVLSFAAAHVMDYWLQPRFRAVLLRRPA